MLARTIHFGEGAMFWATPAQFLAARQRLEPEVLSGKLQRSELDDVALSRMAQALLNMPHVVGEA